MRRGQSTPDRRQAARALVLSGGRRPDGSLVGLARRIDQLSRLLSPVDDEGWSPVGEPRDHSRQIRSLLEAADRHAGAKRYVAALDAYERAEELYQVSAPTIRQKRLRAAVAVQTQHRERELAERTERSKRANEAKRRKRSPRDQKIVARGKEIRGSRPEFGVTAIAQQIRREHLLAQERAAQRAVHEGRRHRAVKVLSTRQILRKLKEHGLN